MGRRSCGITLTTCIRVISKKCHCIDGLGDKGMSRRLGFACTVLVVVGTLSTSSAQAQLFFEADAVFMDRGGDGAGQPLVVGTDAVDGSGASGGFEPGYRLRFGGRLFDYEVDASFLQVSPFGGSTGGTLTNMLILDNTAGNALVDPGSTANVLAFPNGLYAAATQPDELGEGELLSAGANWTYFDRVNYRDFEINMGTARDCRRWRTSLGYRHIRYDGNNQFVISGDFDAIDDGTGLGADNDGLAGTSLTAVGFTGSGSFANLATSSSVDALTYASQGQARNELNGAQVTLAYRVFDGTWVTVEGFGKAGIFQNQVSGQLTEFVVGSGGSSAVYQRQFTDRKKSAAFAGNLGLRAVVSLTDYINLVGGYEATWLAGVALTGDQQSALTTDFLGASQYSVDNTGDVILHGGTLGVEVLW